MFSWLFFSVNVMWNTFNETVVFSLKLCESFYFNIMNHPNQSSASADLNKATLIVLVSASCQPSLGVFQHTLPKFAVTGKFHDGTQSHKSHNDIIGTSDWTIQHIYCSYLTVTAELQNPNSLIFKTEKRSTWGFSLNLVSWVKNERLKKNNVFALHHLSCCLHILLQMFWQEKKTIHTRLISFLWVQEFKTYKSYKWSAYKFC